MDLLKEGGWSDALWSMKRYSPQCYKFAVPRRPQQIKSDVLNSRRVKHVIKKTAEERGIPVQSVSDEVKANLEEIGHNFSLKTLRTMAFMIRKILCTLFRRVLVNSKGLERLRDAAKNYPVVLVPSHRSYLDFLLVSYVCFATDNPLPVIAAGADFLNMRVVGALFRNSGAIFMRRSFMSDPLYWVVFTEYIQTQLQYGDKTLEFFLEGTRSRTGKFLQPKLGVLSMVVDTFTTCRVPDVLICPISISYDRIPEESLYAYELLGIPKPKESLRGLIKSRSVLSENYGSIHVHIGEIEPLSEFLKGRINRLKYACVPRHVFRFLSDEEKRAVKSLGFKILNDLQAGMICPSSVLVAAIMLQNLKGIFFDELVEKFRWLKELCHMWSIPVIAGDSNDVAVVNESIDLLKSSLEKNEHGFVKVRNNGTVQNEGDCAQGKSSNSALPLASSAANIKDEAAIHMLLACRRNVILSHFFRTGVFSLAAQRQQASQKHLVQLFTDFEFLAKMLVKEIPHIGENVAESFEYFRETTELLEQHGSVSVQNDKVVILQEKDIIFSADMWKPILTAYWITCQYFVDYPVDHERPLTEIVKQLQDKAAELLLTGDVKFYEVLSLDLLKNSVLALVDLNAVRAAKSGDGGVSISVPNSSNVVETYQRIGGFLDSSSNRTQFSSTLSKL